MAVPQAAVGIGHDPDAQAFTGRQMQRDVATVVDVGLGYCGTHGRDDLVGNRPRYRCHRRNEPLAKGPAGSAHPPRHRAGEAGGLFHRAPERRQLRDKLLEHRLEPAPAALDGHVRALAERFDNEVDRAVLEMPPAVVEACADRA